MLLSNEILERSTLSKEEIEAKDAEIGAKRSEIRKRISDAKMREELKELDLTPEEYESIFL